MEGFGQPNVAAVPHADLLAAANRYFSPRITLAKAFFDFCHRKQQEDESADDFLTALRAMSEDCDFENRDKYLMLQLIQGMRDKTLQQELLRKENPTLQQTINDMRANETAQQEVGALNSGASFNALRGGHQRTPASRQPAKQDSRVRHQKSCLGCGSQEHMYRSQ